MVIRQYIVSNPEVETREINFEIKKQLTECTDLYFGKYGLMGLLTCWRSSLH